MKRQQRLQKRKSPPGKHWLAEQSASMARTDGGHSIENINRLTAGRGHCPEMFALIQDGTPVPADVGLELLGRPPGRKSPSEILRFVDFPTSPKSTPGANRQPVYRERIRECS